MPKKIDPALQSRAVRLVAEHQQEYPSLTAACEAVAKQVGVGHESVAKRLVGLKGYVANIPIAMMPAAEVIASYHNLWHVEQSLRMSKTDLAARPMFHHQRDAIEAHLTIHRVRRSGCRSLPARHDRTEHPPDRANATTLATDHRPRR